MFHEPQAPRKLQMASGYIAAVVTAAATVAMVLRIEQGGEFLPVFILGGFFVAWAGLPGFVFTLFLARRHGWAGWLPFCVMGGLNALFALVVVSPMGVAGLLGPDNILVLASLRGGVAGGVAYWWTTYHWPRSASDGLGN